MHFLLHLRTISKVRRGQRKRRRYKIEEKEVEEIRV